MKRIVVGVDGSASSIEALRRAVELAGALGAEVEAVSTWQPFYGTVEMPGPVEDLEARAREALSTALDAVDTGEVDVAGVVADGDAAKILIERSEGADMLVVGTRGRGGFAGLLLGSVSQKCAQHASCPVLIVPA
jgi:nucleotide-binding universal stress UspA family protein